MTSPAVANSGPATDLPRSARLLSTRDRRIYHQHPGWIRTSRSAARSSDAVGLKSSSCPSARSLLHASFRPHLTMTPLRFATLHLHQVGTGLSPVSCRTCAAYRKQSPAGPAGLCNSWRPILFSPPLVCDRDRQGNRLGGTPGSATSGHIDHVGALWSDAGVARAAARNSCVERKWECHG